MLDAIRHAPVLAAVVVLVPGLVAGGIGAVIGAIGWGWDGAFSAGGATAMLGLAVGVGAALAPLLDQHPVRVRAA